MLKYRLPAKIGYEEVEVGDNHTYRNKNCYIMLEEANNINDIDELKDFLTQLIKLYCYDNIVKGFEDDCKGQMLHYTLSEQNQ